MWEGAIPTTSLSSFALACEAAAEVVQLRRLARAFLRVRGVRRISYHLVEAIAGPGPPVVQAEGFPDDWVRHYVEHALFEVDPITALSARRTQPFFWSDVNRITRLSPEETAFMRQLETADLGDGLAMQVYGPNMRNAYVGLGFGLPRPDLTSAQIFELKSAVQIAHLRFCELTAAQVAVARDLSPREQEILAWIARGKSNGVIAEILGVSRHTVDTNIRRIFDKLGVSDRTSAVLRGLGTGVLLMDRSPGSRDRVT